MLTWRHPGCPCYARVVRAGHVAWFMCDSDAGIGRRRADELLAIAGFNREEIECELQRAIG
jgi:hypothetical protein